MQELISRVSSELSYFEAVRDYSPEDFTPEMEEKYEVVSFIYDLLCRTSEIKKLEVTTPPEMLDYDDSDSEAMPQYPVSSNPLADMVYSIIAKEGKVSLRSLLGNMVRSVPISQRQIAKGADVSTSSLSEYLSGKYGINSDAYEKVLNYLITLEK